jgi:hypothetical protein
MYFPGRLWRSAVDNADSEQGQAPRGRGVARFIAARPLEFLWILLVICFFLHMFSAGVIFWAYDVAPLLLATLATALFSIGSIPFYMMKKRWDRVRASLVSCFVILMLACIMIPNSIRQRAGGKFTLCKSNLKNIGTALEMYRTDNCGRYPLELKYITPGYMKEIPTCSSLQGRLVPETVDIICPELAGKWHCNPEYLYIRSENPDVYTIRCNGDGHSLITGVSNYPQYDSIQGLLEP